MKSALRTFLSKCRRSAYEAIGNPKYSRPSLNNLDRKLERYLDFDGGFFIEAGANDGYQQSNTYYFERFRGWSGILIEPIPELFERCRRVRRRSIVIQAGLVSSDFREEWIEMQYAGLMSIDQHAFGDSARQEEHLRNAAAVNQIGTNGSYRVRVPARTLGSIIESETPEREVDLLSLDVEGSELSVLNGLNLKQNCPRYICIEARSAPEVLTKLSLYYELVEVLSERHAYQDLLLKRK